MSQEALAEATNITFKHLSNIEVARKYPSLEIIISIANALDVSADDLLTDNLNKEFPPTSPIQTMRIEAQKSEIRKKVAINEKMQLLFY